jgi:hypothetical protein
LHTTATEKLIPKQTISPRGENHFSKRRSESESCSQQSESYHQYERITSKSDTKSENKDVEVRNEEKLMTLLMNAKAKVTAKGDEVKAIEKTLVEFRVEKEKHLDKRIEAESPVTLLPHFATTFNISILICIHITFTIFILNNFISIFKSVASDTLDHHFQTFTIGDLSDCNMLCLSRQTASVQAKTSVKAVANPDSIRLFRVPETRPELRYRKLHRNPFVPNHRFSGQVRKSENDLYHDSFIFNYLDFSR